MSLIDGEPTPLTLGQALVEIAERISWGHTDLQDEVVNTLRTAFPKDVTPYGPAPATGVTDPTVQAMNAQAITLAKQAQELAELRAQLAESQLAEARAQLAAINAGVKPSEIGVNAAPAPQVEAALAGVFAAPVEDSAAAALDAASARTRGEGV